MMKINKKGLATFGRVLKIFLGSRWDIVRGAGARRCHRPNGGAKLQCLGECIERHEEAEVTLRPDDSRQQRTAVNSR
jgi:hypothetical protein